MASDEMKKYRSIDKKDRTKVLSGDTLYLTYVGEVERHEVTVISSNKLTCVVRLKDGEERNVPWEQLEVLA